MHRIAALSCRHPLVILVCAGVITVLSIVVIAVYGKVSTDLRDIMPENARAAKLYSEAAVRFASEYVLICIEPAVDPDPDNPAEVEQARADIQAMKPYVRRLAETVCTHKDYVRSVDYMVGGNGGAFLRAALEERGYLFLRKEDRDLFAAKLTPGAIARQMAANRAKLEAAGVDYFSKRIVPDPLNLLEIAQRRRQGAAGQFVPKVGESFFVTPDGLMILLRVNGRKVMDLEFDRAFMSAVERAEKETWRTLFKEDRPQWESLFRRVKIAHAGGYAIAVSENATLTRDIRSTFVISLVGVLLLFALVFRRWGAVFYIGVPLAASILWTLAVAFLLFGHVSVVSGGFAAILAGLSVDYAIHIYNRYAAECSRGASTQAAIERAIVLTGSGVFFGAVTTAIAFFAIMGTRFKGLAEFGFLGGAGVVMGMGAMLFVLPAMLIARDSTWQNRPTSGPVPGFGLGHLAKVIGRRPRTVLGISIALIITASAYSYVTLTSNFFDADLQALRAESPVFELGDRIQRKFGTSLDRIVVFSRGATAEEALARADEVRKRTEPEHEGSGGGMIMSVDSVTRFVPPRAEQAASAGFIGSIDVDLVAGRIAESARANGLRPSAFDEFVENMRDMVDGASNPRFLSLADLGSDESDSFLSCYYDVDPSAKAELRHTVVTYLYPEPGELSTAWFDRLHTRLGGGEEITAPRLVSLEVRDIVFRDFPWITSFVFIGVAVMLFVNFRSVRWSLAALVPVTCGLALLIATLLLIPHRLNMLNILVFPVIIGIGIDNGIHIIDRFRESGRVQDIITETGRALVTTSLTTMIGFGSLMVSHYPGLQSLGFVATLGMFFCVVTSLLMLPALLACLGRPNTDLA